MCSKFDQQCRHIHCVIGAGLYATGIKVELWNQETFVFHAVLVWIVVVALSLTICFRMVDAVYSDGRSLLKPFNILESYEVPSSGSKSHKKERISTFNILFGRSIWKKNFV